MPTDPTRLALPAGLDLAAAVEGRGVALTVESTVELAPSTWDTPDLRLARNGVSLSYLDGEWTLLLPQGGREQAAGGGQRVPAELRALVTGWVRTGRLRAERTGRVRRTTYRLADADGVTAARLTEEEVATPNGATPDNPAPDDPAANDPAADHPAAHPAAGPPTRVLTIDAGPADSARLVGLLREAGAWPARVPDGWPVTAAGAIARPPYGDLPAPRPLSADTASAVVLAQIFATQAAKLIRLDLPVRHGEQDAVHQMRVTCRRLRASLRTYRPLLAADRAQAMSAELAWLADSLGGARDLEVLRARIADIAEVDPHHPVNPLALARIDDLLLAREGDGRRAAARAMAGRRYTELLEGVVAAGRSPGVTAAAALPARIGFLPLVAATWEEFARRARRLGPARRDPIWHRVRILGKRARYACESAEPAFGAPARRLAARLTGVQDILGEHQDAVITADTMLVLAHQHPADTELVLACGRLVERERTAAQAARAAFHNAWSTVDSPKYTKWLHG
jgi:CHAD domain-containing protein